MAGRPTDYSQETADYICEALSDGHSLKEICDADDMPTRSTVYRWLSLHPEFSDMYARAREEQAETLADEIIAIADESYGDTKEDKHGNTVCDTEFIQRSKLRVDARKWVAAKLKPKKYGDRITQNHEGSVQVSAVERTIVKAPDSDS